MIRRNTGNLACIVAGEGARRKRKMRRRRYKVKEGGLRELNSLNISVRYCTATDFLYLAALPGFPKQISVVRN